MSTLRLPYFKLSPEAYKGLSSVKEALDHSSLGHALIELVYLRVSQINGCAFCLDLHSKSLRKGGESTARLDMLAGWRVATVYTERERAALAWAEAVTHIDTSGTEDAVFEPLKAHFTDAEISDLTFAISLMNAFNRLAVSMRM